MCQKTLFPKLSSILRLHWGLQRPSSNAQMVFLSSSDKCNLIRQPQSKNQSWLTREIQQLYGISITREAWVKPVKKTTNVLH